MRCKLKKQYFNGIPANAVRTTSPLSTMTDMQWKQLVDMWSNPKHKVPFLNIYQNCCLTEYMDCLSTNVFFVQEKCLKNKDSHELVQYHQMIGSQSYVAQCYVMVR